MEPKSMGRAKGHDTVTETIPNNVSAQSTCASAQRRAVNGGNDIGGAALLVGRWPMSMFQIVERDGSIEIWRRDDQMSSADVRDAANRDPQAGIKALNRLHRAWYPQE